MGYEATKPIFSSALKSLYQTGSQASESRVRSPIIPRAPDENERLGISGQRAEEVKEGSKALFKELGDEANKQGAKC